MNNESILNSKTKLYLKQDLKIIKLACFENEQIHTIFNDNTTMIVYPGFKYITYFHSDNQILRMKTENPLRLYNIGFKIYLILNVYNIFSNNIPTIIYSYLHQYEKEIEDSTILKREENSPLIVKAYWINDYSYYEKEDEYYLINSHDNSTKLYILKNQKIIKIEYLQLINQQENLYYKAVKYFSINNIPIIWNVPLILLIENFNLNISKNELKIDSNSIIINGKEYSNELPELYNKSFQLNNYPIDEINPIAFIFNRDFDLKFFYSENFTYLINHNYIDIILNEFPHLYISTDNQMNILYYQFIDNESIKSIEIEKYFSLLNEYNFKDDFLPELILQIVEIKKNYKKYEKIQDIIMKKNIYKNIEFIDNAITEIKKDFNFDGDQIYIYNEIANVGEFSAFFNRAIKINFFDKTILKMDSKMEKIYILDKLGNKFVFIANNLDNTFSHFLFYYDYAIQFFNFCFMNRIMKKEIGNNLRFINEISNASLSRIELHNKVNYGDNIRTECNNDNYIHEGNFNFDISRYVII